jgi:hypothetical protein
MQFGIFPDFEPHQIKMGDGTRNRFFGESNQSSVKFAREFSAFLTGRARDAHMLQDNLHDNFPHKDR